MDQAYLASIHACLDRSPRHRGCWLWVSPCGGTTYPQAWHAPSGKSHLVRRVLWEAAHGEAIPDGVTLRATCRNRLCCAPAHMRRAGDPRESDAGARPSMDGVAPQPECDGSFRDRVVCRICGEESPALGALIWHVQAHCGIGREQARELREALVAHRRRVREWQREVGEIDAQIADVEAREWPATAVRRLRARRAEIVGRRPVTPHGIELRLLFARVPIGTALRRHVAPERLPWEHGVQGEQQRVGDAARASRGAP